MSAINADLKVTNQQLKQFFHRPGKTLVMVNPDWAYWSIYSGHKFPDSYSHRNRYFSEV